jgi:dephospho-CoA kinase
VRALRIGLTGPIGCGKSTVAGWLAARGAAVIDADAIARSVTAPGRPAHDAVLAAFGSAVRAPDGSLDRAVLAAIVFADAARLGELEAIVHPAVRPELLAEIAAAEEAGAWIVAVEAIKLVESGLAELCDETWLVTCDPGAQAERLAARGVAPPDASSRIEAQGDIRTRLTPFATRVLDTSGSAADAERAVDAALEEAFAARAGMGA